MKSIFQKLWMTLVILCASVTMSAYDFEVDGVAYTIISFTDFTVRVDQLVNDNVTKLCIPECVEYKNKSLKVTSVANEAFKDNTTLSEVSLPNTILSIGYRAFMNNTSLITINLPQNLSRIGYEAFSGCSSITSIFIPNGIQEIESSVFYGCKSLTKIDLHSNIKSIGANAFNSSGLLTIDIPHSVLSLGKYVFAGTQLVEINLHDGIKTIPEGCFAGCKELREITFTSRTIESYAFRGCVALQKISLPEHLTTIGDEAFEGCTNLIEFSIPSEVSSIEPTILWNCPSICKLTIGKNLSGLPVHCNIDWGTGRYSYLTLGGYYSYRPPIGLLYGPKIEDETYLQSIKEFIIEDSDEPFSIKGFQINGNTPTPPFTNTELNYYYVGRPLVDIKEWSSEGVGFTVKDILPGTGRIKELEIGGSCTSVPYFYQKIDTLKLGVNIKVFDMNNIYTKDLVKIECLSETPPTCKYGSFPANVYTDAILCVPFGCKEAYANAEIWKNFWNIYEVNSETGIFKIFNDKDDVLYHVYNIAGQLIGESYSLEEIKQLPNGIYIMVNKSQKYKIKIQNHEVR